VIWKVPFYIKHYLTPRVFSEVSKNQNGIKVTCYLGSDGEFPSPMKPWSPGTSDKQGLESDCVPVAVSKVNTVHVLCVSAPDGQQPTAPPREFPRHRKVPRRTPARRTLTASRTPYCTPQHPLPSPIRW
jgi:hypothetical protein